MNNEFVSVPRDLAQRMVDCAEAYVDIDDADLVGLRTLLGQSVAQHQGEPVAVNLPLYPGRKPMRSPQDRTLPRGYAEGWNDCIKAIENIGPLYTHADTGEVERVREGISKHWKVVCDQRAELDTLRAQLAERDALLRDVRRRLQSERWGWESGLIGRIDAALSASAEPSAPKCEHHHHHHHQTYQLGDPEVRCADCGVVTGYPVGTPVDLDELISAVRVLRSQGFTNLSAAVESARSALERKS